MGVAPVGIGEAGMLPPPAKVSFNSLLPTSATYSFLLPPTTTPKGALNRLSRVGRLPPKYTVCALPIKQKGEAYRD